MTVTKVVFPYALAIGIVLAASSAPVRASNDDAAFGGDCVMGLALGKDIHTDCSVTTVYKGTKYCFGNETARTLFLKRPDDFLLQAHIYNASREEDKAQTDGERP